MGGTPPPPPASPQAVEQSIPPPPPDSPATVDDLAPFPAPGRQPLPVDIEGNAVEKELRGCRVQAGDLPDHVFGSIISIDLASAVLAYFLEEGLVSVRGRKKWDAVSNESAALHARTAAEKLQAHRGTCLYPPSNDEHPKDGLKWEWGLWDLPQYGQGASHKQHVASFLNAVADQAFQAVDALGRRAELHSREPRLMFSPMLKPDSALPMADPRELDTLRPGLLLLPVEAFPLARSGPVHATVVTPETTADPPTSAEEEEDANNRPRKRARLASPANDGDRVQDSNAPSPSTGTRGSTPPSPVSATSSFRPPSSAVSNISNPQSGSSDEAPNSRSAFASAEISTSSLDDQCLHPSSTANPVDLKPSVLTPSALLSALFLAPAFGRAQIPSEAYVLWLQTRIVGACKSWDMPKAVSQVHRYQRGLRRAQPWLRFCLGFAFTGTKKEKLAVNISRADASGVEEAMLRLWDSRGALDIIRVALGFALCTEEEAGADPTTWVDDGDREFTTGSKRKRNTTTALRIRSLKKIYLDPVKPEATTCLMYYPIFDAMSVCDRGTRVWAGAWGSSRQDLDIISGGTEDGKALVIKTAWQPLYKAEREAAIVEHAKLHHASHVSSHRVLLPIKLWIASSRGILYSTSGAVRGFSEYNIPGQSRVLQYSMMGRKKPLSAFKTMQEVVGGLVDAIKGHEYLCSIGILHRDVSLTNVLLAVDPEREGTRGYLMDLDNATRFEPIPEYDGTKETTQHIRGINERRYRQQKASTDLLGTFPSMAIAVINGALHEPKHDLESFFYVFYLFLFTYSGPLPAGRSIGSRFTERDWPPALRSWVQKPVWHAVSEKTSYMSRPRRLVDEFERDNPTSDDAPVSHRNRVLAIGNLITDFHGAVWEKYSTTWYDARWSIKRDIHHADVCRTLEDWLERYPTDGEWIAKGTRGCNADNPVAVTQASQDP